MNNIFKPKMIKTNLIQEKYLPQLLLLDTINFSTMIFG